VLTLHLEEVPVRRADRRRHEGLRANIGQALQRVQYYDFGRAEPLHIYRPNLNTVVLPLREPLETRETRRHKKQVAIVFGPGSELL